MYHIAKDLRAKKSADLILQGLYKSLKEKPLKSVKVSDISRNSYVSRATFYRLFDSIHDVLAYQCDLIVDEMLESLKNATFNSRKEAGIFCVKIWLGHDELIQAMVENNLHELISDGILRHKDELQTLYHIDYDHDPYSEQFVFFLSAIIFTCFAIFHKEKGKRSIEEVVDATNKMVANIIQAWGIDE